MDIQVDRERWIYGVSVNRETKEAFGFNRDYIAQPEPLRMATVYSYREQAEQTCRGRAFGDGIHRPRIDDESVWDTYWMPLSKVPSFLNGMYDKSKYYQ